MPCTDERDIKQLASMNNKDIRPEFQNQVNIIRQKIFTQCGPKKLNGSYLSSRMYVKMAEEYVKSINNGSVPMIQNAWQSVLENECIQAQDNAKKVYDQEIAETFRDRSKIHKKAVLDKMLKEIRDKAFTAFSVINTVKEGDEDLFERYYREVLDHIERKEKHLIEQNMNLAEG